MGWYRRGPYEARLQIRHASSTPSFLVYAPTIVSVPLSSVSASTIASTSTSLVYVSPIASSPSLVAKAPIASSSSAITEALLTQRDPAIVVLTSETVLNKKALLYSLIFNTSTGIAGSVKQHTSCSSG